VPQIPPPTTRMCIHFLDCCDAHLPTTSVLDYQAPMHHPCTNAPPGSSSALECNCLCASHHGFCKLISSRPLSAMLFPAAPPSVRRVGSH
jgi:hypothetical protein